MKRIGILGGTFNPVHTGHLTIAEAVREKFRLDQVIFVPCYLPPHKSGKNVIASRYRLEMVRRAVQGNPYFAVSVFEARRKEKSYSIHTVRHFHQKYPGAKIFFIIGGDHLSALHTWKRIEEIVKIVSFVAVYRPGFKKGSCGIKAKSIIIPGVHTSSSDIRRRIAAGRTVRYLIPENVLRYIQEHKLYKK